MTISPAPAPCQEPGDGVARVTASETASAPGLDVSEVIEATLNANPEILLRRQQVEAAMGALTQTRGAFQPIVRTSVRQENDLRPLTKNDSASLGGRSFLPIRTTQYEIGYEHHLRSGTTFRPQISFIRTDSDIPATDPENRAEVAVGLRRPLARGQGARSSAVKQEEAAALDLEADLAGLQATVHSALSQSLAAYWRYLGNVSRLEILRAAEERAGLLASQTAELIDADVTPASERSQVEANLAAKQADRISAETQVRQDRRTLGLLLGYSPEAIEALPMPVTGFPDVASGSSEFLATTVPEELVQAALGNRPDLAEARIRQKAAGKRTFGARDRERPQVDLDVSVGYSGFDRHSRLSSYISPFSNGIPGLNAVAQVEGELPFRDLTARGVTRQYEAAEARLGIVTDQTIRAIRSGVAQAHAMVVNGLLQRSCAASAVESYRQAVENEKSKLAHGMSTIIDLITLEDRLTGALLSLIQARVALAEAVVELKYQCGTIVEPSSGTIPVSR
ncbi:MAG TPA: TolC family protein [Candidatus Ozemobacteraceae bacterium]|nr:TolC family protein [Candidatus Ozemobacteraceae bacterium]